MTAEPIPLADLLEHGAMLRQLCRALVSPADVDDVVQTTYAVATAAGARPAGWPLRQWLGGVARNVARRSARTDRRRLARERHVARSEHEDSAAEVALREETRRRVVDAVLGLSEPYRRAVLLRFYDGLPPRAIAERLGLSPATVRSHLHRALEQLRQRLDRDHGGDRRAWVAPLLPLLDSRSAPLFTLGGLAVSTKFLLSAAAVVALLLLGWLASGDGPTPNSDVLAAAAAAPAGDAVAQGAALAATPPRREVAPARVEAPVAEAPAVETFGLRLRYVQADGTAVTAAALAERFAATGTPAKALLVGVDPFYSGGMSVLVRALLATPDSWQHRAKMTFVGDGAVLEPTAATGRVHVLAPRPGALPWVSARIDCAGAPTTVDVPMPEATSAVLRFVEDDTGAPMAGAEVIAFVEFGDDRAFAAMPAMHADAGGEVRLWTATTSKAVLRPPVWWVESATHAARFSPQEGDSTQEVRVPRRGALTGTVQLPDGRPAAGWTVGAAPIKHAGATARVADDGTFRLAAFPAGHAVLGALGSGDDDVLGQSASVRAGGTTVVKLGGIPDGCILRGSVTAGGRPLAGITIGARSRDDQVMATTGADGGFELRGIGTEARVFVLLGDPSLSDDFTITRDEPLPSTPAVQWAAFDLPRGRLRVRTVDADGNAVNGVKVSARPRVGQADRFAGWTYRAGWCAATGEDGTVELPGLPDGQPLTLGVGGGDFVRTNLDLDAAPVGDAAPALEVTVTRK